MEESLRQSERRIARQYVARVRSSANKLREMKTALAVLFAVAVVVGCSSSSGSDSPSCCGAPGPDGQPICLCGSGDYLGNSYVVTSSNASQSSCAIVFGDGGASNTFTGFSGPCSDD
jgi:hypothetical protein